MSEESTDSNNPAQAELTGTFTCDVCGLDTPHGHTEFDVIQQRYARKAFEKRYTNVVTSSWDGDTSSIGPVPRGPRPEDGYWGREDDRRWQTYVNAWLDAWQHFKALMDNQRAALLTWGVQVGLNAGEPLLEAADGSTLNIDQAIRFASQEDAQRRCDQLNSGPPRLRTSAIPIDLNALADEQLDENFDDSAPGKETAP